MRNYAWTINRFSEKLNQVLYTTVPSPASPPRSQHVPLAGPPWSCRARIAFEHCERARSRTSHDRRCHALSAGARVSSRRTSLTSSCAHDGGLLPPTPCSSRGTSSMSTGRLLSLSTAVFVRPMLQQEVHHAPKALIPETTSSVQSLIPVSSPKAFTSSP